MLLDYHKLNAIKKGRTETLWQFQGCILEPCLLAPAVSVYPEPPWGPAQQLALLSHLGVGGLPASQMTWACCFLCVMASETEQSSQARERAPGPELLEEVSWCGLRASRVGPLGSVSSVTGRPSNADFLTVFQVTWQVDILQKMTSCAVEIFTHH